METINVQSDIPSSIQATKDILLKEYSLNEFTDDLLQEKISEIILQITKGVYISIKEQVENLGGTISVSDNIPHGVCVQITIPMKGDGSYKYFVS